MPEHILEDCTLTTDRKEAWPEETTQYQKLWRTVAEIQSTADFVNRNNIKV
jgi:hypothetical protein